MRELPDAERRPPSANGRAGAVLSASLDESGHAVLHAPAITGGAALAGRYRLGPRIGAGGMATIFRAHDELLERDVAVKVLHAHLADDPGLLSQFRTEARHAAALAHPHIVNVYDEGVEDLPYIVMELIDGPSLREVLRERGRLTPGQALTVVAPVCAALARAHDAGVVHRDIKPENVLVDAEGRAKVADFGIARVIAATSHTQTGALVGSVHYLAPELVDGREADARSDQYALGVVLYELLTGEKALPADTPMAVALRHARERVPAPSARVDGIPRAVDAVVARATAHDPEDRYPDMLALSRALEEGVRNGPSKIMIEDADGQDRTLVVPPATGTMSERDSASPSRQRDESRSRGRRVARWALSLLLLLAALTGGGLASWHYLVAPVIDVPTVVGMSESEALATTDELGLGLVVSGREYRLDVPEGVLIAQEPAAGEQRRRGADLAVVVSRGPRSVEMPEVVGLRQAEAREALEGNAFAIDITRRFHDTVPRGTVLGQDPPQGVAVDQGATVNLVVSRGIRQVTVPDVTGATRQEAESLLADARLAGEFSQSYSDEFPEAGTVFGQSVEAGARIDKGSVVSATVSRGPLTVPMPNLRGQPVEAAQADLEAIGLVVNVEGQPRPRFGPFARGDIGLVEEQLPQPDEPVQRGDTVTLFTYDE